MKILAVDLGLSRTGLAICDEKERLASPIQTITEHNLDKVLLKIKDVIAERTPALVVVGHPLNMDGSAGESAKRAEKFANDLQGLTGIPAVLWDERLTTVSAIAQLNATNVRGRKRKEVVDTVSAVIILENYLESRRLNNKE